MSTEQGRFNVALIGFSVKENQNIEQLFQLSHKRQRCYNLMLDIDTDTQKIDILFLCLSSQQAKVEATNLLKKSPQIAIVIAAKDQPANSAYHYTPYPLRASLILETLDQINFSVNDVAASASEYNALVVDDSAAMRKALEVELQRIPQKLNIDQADCGEAALELAAQKKYDLIFLDIVMPGIDGFEVCKTLRKTIKKTPIIMLTGKTSPLDEVKGVMAGCSTYLTKPVDRNEFQKVLKRVVNWLDEYQKK
ncbi:MAG: response regulator [Methyloprofundus sp.]|nr:response regulator [Methyloprofundus sp.]